MLNKIFLFYSMNYDCAGVVNEPDITPGVNT